MAAGSRKRRAAKAAPRRARSKGARPAASSSRGRPRKPAASSPGALRPRPATSPSRPLRPEPEAAPPAPPKDLGAVAWRDLTVPDARRVRDFYMAVVGWGSSPVDMGGYDDFSMIAAGSGETVAGICHARGTNADLPAHWLIYITVPDVDASAAACAANGGSIVVAPRAMGGGRFCVIRDPAGAVCALYAPPSGAGG